MYTEVVVGCGATGYKIQGGINLSPTVGTETVRGSHIFENFLFYRSIFSNRNEKAVICLLEFPSKRFD